MREEGVFSDLNGFAKNLIANIVLSHKFAWEQYVVFIIE